MNSLAATKDIIAISRKKILRRWLALGLAVNDIICICAAFVLAGMFRLGFMMSESQLTNILAVSLPIYVGIAINTRSYGTTALSTFWVSYSRSAAAFIFAMGAVLLTAFFLKASADFSRVIFATGVVLALLFLFIGRWLLSQLSKKLLNNQPMAEVIIVDEIAVEKSSDTPIIDAVAENLKPDLTNADIIQRLGLITQDMDRIIVHCKPENRQAWAFTLKALDVNAEIVTPELSDLAPIALNRRDGHIALMVSQGPLRLSERVIKRGFDILCALIAIPLLIIPMIITAIAIRIESPGPVIFSQQRIGLGNISFKIYKFRSMRIETSDSKGERSTSRDDDRITRVGAFIRKCSMDELPQIFNVLLGTMSMVGPRPHAIGSRAENMLFWDIDARYWHRHAIKPGLTGLAQVRGFRGATEKREDLEERLQSDLDYRANWSLWSDIKIILMTFRVLMHQNAY